MTVSILGSEELDFRPADILRFARNCAYPHPIDHITTTEEYGVAASAREAAEDKEIPLTTFPSWRDAVDAAQMIVVFRKKDEYPEITYYCAERNRLYKEYVL